jgi:hypothetical protein
VTEYLQLAGRTPLCDSCRLDQTTQGHAFAGNPPMLGACLKLSSLALPIVLLKASLLPISGCKVTKHGDHGQTIIYRLIGFDKFWLLMDQAVFVAIIEVEDSGASAGQQPYITAAFFSQY